MYKLFIRFQFHWQFNFSPILSSWVSRSALVDMKAVFSCLGVLLKSRGGVKSVFAKINLYDLLSCSIFRFLHALWEMKQAEPSFLCRIINSAFLVYMFLVRQNRELYLCLLHPSWKLGSAGHKHMLLLFPLATLGNAGWIQPAPKSEYSGNLVAFWHFPQNWGNLQRGVLGLLDSRRARNYWYVEGVVNFNREKLKCAGDLIGCWNVDKVFCVIRHFL